MIVYCSHDLIFATKIRSTAEVLGVVTRPVRDLQMFRKRLDRFDDGKPNDPVSAVMVDLETGPTGLEILEQSKRYDQALPVIMFGSHVATELFDKARSRGADFVMPRSAFSAQLPQLLRRFAAEG